VAVAVVGGPGSDPSGVGSVIGLEPVTIHSAAMIAQQTMALHTVLHRPKAL
jgi:hypothetical protein